MNIEIHIFQATLAHISLHLYINKALASGSEGICIRSGDFTGFISRLDPAVIEVDREQVPIDLLHRLKGHKNLQII